MLAHLVKAAAEGDLRFSGNCLKYGCDPAAAEHGPLVVSHVVPLTDSDSCGSAQPQQSIFIWVVQ